MAEIDSLEISIQSKVDSAAKSIDTLINKLGKIPRTLNNISKIPVKLDFDSTSIDPTKLKYSLQKSIDKVKVDASRAGEILAGSFNITNKKTTEDIKNQINSMIQEAVDSFNGESLNISAKSFDNLTKTIIENGKIAKSDLSSSFSDLKKEYSDLYDYFKSNKIYISDSLKYDIGKNEFNELLKENLSNITRKSGEGVELNSIWDELSEKFPTIISKDTINASEQVLQILKEIKEARDNIKPIAIDNLLGEDYKTAVNDIKDSIKSLMDKPIGKLYEEAEKKYTASNSSVIVNVEIDEEAIVSQIQSSIRKASKVKYEPIKIELGINENELKQNLSEKLKAANIPDLINSFSQFGNISFDTKSISELSDAITILGRKTATEGIQNIPKLTKVIKDMLASFSEAPKIDSSIVQMTQSLAELARTQKLIEKSGEIKSSIDVSKLLSGDLSEFQNTQEKIISASKEIEEEIENVSKGSKLFFDHYNKNLMGAVFGDSVKDVTNYDEAVQKYGENAGLYFNRLSSAANSTQEKIKTLSESFKDVGKNLDFTGNSEQLENEINKLNYDLAKLYERKDRKIDLGEVDTKPFRDIIYEIQFVKNRIEDLENLRPEILSETLRENAEKAKTLREQLKQLKVPEIQEDNLEKLQKALKRTEADIAKLKADLENEITMGRISVNVDDDGFRKFSEKIALSEKQAEALREKIKEIGEDSNKSGSKFEKFKSVFVKLGSFLPKFSSHSKKASSSTNMLEKSIKKLSSSMSKFSKSTEKITSGLASFIKKALSGYVTFEGLRKSVENSMDFIETLNYFDAAFEQVASNADLSSFKKMGYKSADLYYESFSERAKEVTAKMTGFEINERGLLESTRLSSLGLDINQLMNYQAMFGQMSSSMGVSSETALKLSQALTEIGADLASVKNMDFEKVWEDMASGLTGMSRALDKYGVNIRDVNLQQKLNELGINASITALNQNDKALLRTIVLLESTKYAWADLADTINQPANQLRLIQANFQNLSRTIGSLFLPIVKTVLPYINALVIAFQRLFAWLGNLLGIDISDISTSIGGADISDVLDQTENLESSLGGAKDEANKLNKTLRQFDELKVITTKEDDSNNPGGIGGSGILDNAFNEAFSKYQEEWDKAFANLDNKAQEIADRIEQAFEPIREIIENLLAGNFFEAGENVGELINSILDLDWDGLEEKFTNFSGNLAEFANGILYGTDFELLGSDINEGLEIVFSALIEFIDTFDFEELGRKIAQGIKSMFPDNGWWSRWGEWIGKKFKAIILTMKGFVEEMSVIDPKTGLTGWQQLGKELGNGINKLFEEIPWETLGETFAGLFNGLFELGGKFLETVEFDKIGSSIGLAIKTGLDQIDWKTVKETVGLAGKKLAEFLEGLITPENMYSVGKTIAETLNTAFIGIFNFFDEIDKNGDLGGSIAGGINGFLDYFDLPSLIKTLDKIVNVIFNALKDAVSKIHWGEALSKIGESLKEISLPTIGFAIGAIAFKYLGKQLTSSILVGILQKSLGLIPGLLGGVSATGALAVGGIALAATLVWKIATNWDEVTESFDWLGRKVTDFLGITETEILGVHESEGGHSHQSADRSFGDNSKGISGAFNETRETIKRFTEESNQKLLDFRTTVGETFVEMQEVAKEATTSTSDNLIAISTGFNTSLEAIKTTINSNKINTFPEVNWENSREQGAIESGKVANKLIDRFRNTVKERKEDISGTVSNTVKNAVSSAKKSTEMIESVMSLGLKVANEFTKKFKSEKSNIASAASKTLSSALQTAKQDSGLLSQAASIGATIGNKIGSSMQNAFSGFTLTANLKSPGSSGTGKYESTLTGYAAGGFPEPFSVFAAGEGGVPEILGTVGGRTAVAGGEEITGIREAIAIASHDEVQLLKEQNKLLQLLLQKEIRITTNDIGRAAQRYAKDHLNRTGNPAYAM